ncbi:MAG: XRE family transcriptional regulator [Clostridiaceae bacterium]
MNIGQRIKEKREQRRMTLDELSKLVGVTRQTLSRYETGVINNIPSDMIESIASALRTTPAQLMGWDDEDSPRKPIGVKVPVLGCVPAGIPLEAIECIIDYEEIPVEMARTGEFFGLQVKGDSMAPRILDGDVVIVRRQPTVESGDVAIIMVNGDDATCKRIMYHENGLSLVSNNPTFQPRYFTAQEVERLPIQVIGKVVELRGKF